MKIAFQDSGVVRPGGYGKPRREEITGRVAAEKRALAGV